MRRLPGEKNKTQLRHRNRKNFLKVCQKESAPVVPMNYDPGDKTIRILVLLAISLERITNRRKTKI